VSFNPRDDGPAAPRPILPQADSASQLREQAAACRRLAVRARTHAGKKGLHALGEHFDEQASKIDPTSLRR
jgi:hypothetical protein